MADSILTSAAFATAFMKPVPGETIDAIYGRKIADNTGFLYYRIQKEFELHGGYSWESSSSFSQYFLKQAGTTYFIKTPGRNTLSGTCFGTVSSTGFVSVSVNGTSILSFSGAGTAFGTAWSKDISGLTNDVKYPVSFSAGIKVETTGTQHGQVTCFDGWSSA